MTHWGDVTAEARKRLTPVDTQLLRQFAARERQPYDQVLLPLLLEAAADEIDGYRARETAERELIQHRLQRAAEMRRGEAI